jgi:hypothetical protein
MVKTVGRLPNVLYLLSYDRDIVWDALDEASRRGVAVRISAKSCSKNRTATTNQRGSIGHTRPEVAFTALTPNNLRWLVMVRDGVRRWIKHPRDVQRLANAVKFSWPALKGEIDQQDLFIVEGLRLFDERAFDWIRWNRDWLFSEGRFLMADDSSHSSIKYRSNIANK